MTFIEIINDPYKVYEKIRNAKGVEIARKYAQKHNLNIGDSPKEKPTEILKADVMIASIHTDRIVTYRYGTNKCTILFASSYPDLFRYRLQVGDILSITYQKETKKIIDVSW